MKIRDIRAATVTGPPEAALRRIHLIQFDSDSLHTSTPRLAWAPAMCRHRPFAQLGGQDDARQVSDNATLRLLTFPIIDTGLYSGRVRTPLWCGLGLALAAHRGRRLSRFWWPAMGLLIAASCLSAQSPVTVADHILGERDFADLSAETAVADHDGNLWIVSQYRGADRLVCIKPNGETCANTALPPEIKPGVPCRKSVV
jgi:hypothetical protein